MANLMDENGFKHVWSKLKTSLNLSQKKIENISKNTIPIDWISVDSVFNDNLINNVQSIAYGEDRFVAGTSKGELAYSLDGLVWTKSSQAVLTGSIDSIAYGDGVFLAGTSKGELAYSLDGATWTNIPQSIFTSILRISYGVYNKFGSFRIGGNYKKSILSGAIPKLAYIARTNLSSLKEASQSFTTQPIIQLVSGFTNESLVATSDKILEFEVYSDNKFSVTEFSTSLPISSYGMSCINKDLYIFGNNKTYLYEGLSDSEWKDITPTDGMVKPLIPFKESYIGVINEMILFGFRNGQFLPLIEIKNVYCGSTNGSTFVLGTNYGKLYCCQM